MSRWSCLAFVAALLFSAGCGKKPTPPPTDGGPKTDPNTNTGPVETEAPAADAVLLDPSTLKEKGSVKITVKWTGDKPKLLRPFEPVDKEGYCKSMHPDGKIEDESVLVNGNNTLRNVHVRVSKGLSKYKFNPSVAEQVVRQEGCQYKPHIVAVMTGQPVVIQDDDKDGFEHNVHKLPGANSEFNFPQNKKGQRSDVLKFTSEEFGTKIKCNIHDWMGSYIFICRHPYFGVSGDMGEVLIENLPPGEYTLEAFHEKYGKQIAKVTVKNGETATVEVSFHK